MYQMKSLLIHFDPYHQFDLDLIFKVTGANCNISESNLKHGTFSPQMIYKPIILHTDTSSQGLPMDGDQGPYDLYQGHRSSRFVPLEMQ